MPLLLGVRVVIALLEIADRRANIRDVILKFRLVCKNFLERREVTKLKKIYLIHQGLIDEKDDPKSNEVKYT